VETSNSCARTLIFGSFLLLTFIKFFPLPLFRFFDLVFYYLFSLFICFLSPIVFPLFFTLVSLIWFHLYPTLLGNKRLWLLVVVVIKMSYKLLLVRSKYKKIRNIIAILQKHILIRLLIHCHEGYLHDLSVASEVKI
jgi:hypothetical protein